jgi:hypothetical protein
MNTRTGLLMISRIALLAGLSTLAVGCGGGSKAAPITEETYCTQRATAECATVAVTCSVATPQDCETMRAALCMQEGATIVAADAARVFDPTKVPACVAKAKSVYGLPLIKPSDLADLANVCNYVYHGDAAMMAACTTKYDCKDATVICDKGECATQVIKAANLQCSDHGAVCGASQYCSMTNATDYVCVNKASVGQPCSAATPCGSGLYCTNGTCQLSLGINAKCCTDSDCSADFPYCNPFAGYACGKGLTFATHSPSCVPFGDTLATPAMGSQTCSVAPTPDAGTDATTD